MQKNNSLGQSDESRKGLVRDWIAKFEQGGVSTQHLEIGIVASRYNSEVVESILREVIVCLNQVGILGGNITIKKVPGALEIPFALQELANSIQPNAMIALGCVIRGETYHFEVVSNGVFSGVMRVQLDSHIPIANGVLTCESIDQAIDRHKNKAHECVEVITDMVVLAKKAH